MSDSIVPIHLGVILDGNRRWAKANNLASFDGHKKGYENLKSIAEIAFDRGVQFVSAYVFSTENWSRSKDEVNYLMDLTLAVFNRDLRAFVKKGFKVLWLGVPDKLSTKHLTAIAKIEELSRHNTKGTIGLCFNYGGKREIIDAMKLLIKNGQEPTEKSLEENLYEPGIPPLDLIIRTGGERRLSNFMLWRAAYSELYFIDKYWPEFSESDLDKALKDFSNRQRRFGA